MDSEHRDFELKKALALAACIKEDTGIELTWKEIVDIKLNYTNGTITPDLIIPAIFSDFFGLDYYGLEKQVANRSLPEYGIFNRSWGGLDMLGTPEFKEYCRHNVHYWREQRDLV